MARPSYQKVVMYARPDFYSTFSVTAGTPSIVTPDMLPIEVTVVPGSGGTMLVETRTVANGTWVPWSAGATSEVRSMMFSGRCHSMRFTATGADGTVEIAG